MAILMVLTAFPVTTAMAAGSSEASKPADGTTQGRPFVSDNPSHWYRIPSMVTLDDGTVVAAADARWDGGMDGGGNDVITARSTDNGDTWSYTWAGYYGDNGNVFNKASTSYCDSNIATDGKTLYMLSTFFASGVAINGTSANAQPSKDTGLDSQGRLLLARNGGDYDYYVGAVGADGYASIYRTSDSTVVSHYKVNGEFELFKDGAYVGCVWYSNCEFQAKKCQYLFFRTSTDGGKTWSAPSLVNARKSGEKFLGAGPGRAIVTDDGTICMPVYVYGDNTWGSGDASQATSFIYSKDRGKTWSRTANFTSTSSFGGSGWSSEAQLVDLGNGVVRCFYRNGKKKIRYCDATWNGSGYQWGDVVDTGIDIWGNCQLSAVMYPYLIDGKRAILVSSPSSTEGRKTGAIFTLLLNDDNTVSTEYAKKTITAEGATFAYSCLTVLKDGRVADLYETDACDFTYKVYDIETLTGMDVDVPTTTDIQMNVGQKKTLTFSAQDVSNSASDIVSLSAAKEVPGATANKATDANYSGDSVSVKRALYTFTSTGTEYTIAHAGMYLSVGTNGKAGYPGASTPANVTLSAVDGGFQLLQDGHYGLYFQQKDSKGNTVNHFERWDFTGKGKNDQDEAEVLAATTFQLYRRIRTGETGSTELPGYIQVNTVDDGEKYLIVYHGTDGYFLLNPSTSTTNMYAHCLKANGGSTVDGYNVTVTANAVGNAVVQAGLNTYNITVVDGDLAVTGVVKYDPVIYTHGDASGKGQPYMYCGSLISDGSQAGEKETHYKVNDSRYTITGIKCVEDSAADIKYADGKLSGTLHIADTVEYANYNKGETVTIETNLTDTDGNVWTQTDKLYVASNPVAGHTFGAQEIWGNAGNTVNLLPLIFVAEGSYGNTDRKTYNDTRRVYNAYNVEDANALTYTKDRSTVDNDKNDGDKYVLSSSSAGDKIAGLCNHQKAGNTSGNQEKLLEVKAPEMISAYYYYDMSSDNNQGIKRLNASGTEFSFELGITPVQVSGDKVYVDASNGVEFPTNDNLNYVSGNGFSTPTAYYSSYNFGDGKQYHTVTGSTNVAANSTATMDGASELQAMVKSSWTINYLVTKTTYYATNWLNLGVTFQVKVCNKSNERTPYNEAVSKVRVSTDYTKETWDKYTTALLNTEAYLNNYTLLTTDETTQDVGTVLKSTYTGLTKRADFTELEKVVEQNKAAYDKGFAGNVTDTDQNKYTVDSWQNFENAYKAGAELLAQYPEKGRNNVAGFTVGPDSTEKTTQTQIDETATQLKNSGLVVAADASAYESARSISATIDRTAFPDGGTAITNTVTNGNSTIYKAYNGKDYVNLPAAKQGTVDDFTTALLSNMNVGESSQSGRTFTVACTVNGNAFETKERKTLYYYGTIAHLNFSAYQSQDTVCVVHTATGDTKIDLAKCNYQLSLLVQRDTTITVTTATRPNVIVADYFGTILGAFEGATSVTVKGNTVTVGDTVITAKDSPKYTFTGWTWSEGTHVIPAGQVAQIVQKGTPTGVDVKYTVSNSGTAANALINGATQYTAHVINKPLKLTSDNAAYWTRTVNGVETLASYEQNVTLFSTKTATTYTAYASLNDLPKDLQKQAESGTPALNGVGFFADKKFTLSCDYSAGADVTVLEVGVIYSATKNGKDTLVKGGGDDVQTVVSRNVANWTGSPNSGTFTMTKKGSDTGSHYMRMYVSYRTSHMNTQVPFVVYGDIYQCVNGAVSPVN